MTCCLVDDVENADEDDLFIFIVNPPLKIVDGKYLLEEEEEEEEVYDDAADEAARENENRTVVVAEKSIDVVATRQTLIRKGVSN